MYQPIPQYFHQWWRRKVEKGNRVRRRAIGGKSGHGLGRTHQKNFQSKVSPTQKSALLCPAYLTEVLQASHTSFFVAGDSMREPGCFSIFLLLTIRLDLLLALPFLGE